MDYSSWCLELLLGKLHSVLESRGSLKEDKESASSLKRLESKLMSISNSIASPEGVYFEWMYWPPKLVDAVYDAEDEMDEILYEATRSKLEVESQTLKSWARGLLPALIKRNGKRMRSIWELEELIPVPPFFLQIIVPLLPYDIQKQETHNELRLSESDSLPASTSLLDKTTIYRREEDRSNIVNFLPSDSGDDNLDRIASVDTGGMGKTTLELLPESNSLPASTSSLGETTIYGREDDWNKIVSFLLTDSGDDNLDRIALVGNEGVGKTTLAQLVYKDEKVSEHFELKAWVDVSGEIDTERITRTILDVATFCSFSGYGDELLGKSTASLAGKKYLLVLDDVWVPGDFRKWKDLESSFKSCARGSKIIVTTRSESVAVNIGCSTRYPLKGLTVDDCWSILAKSASAGPERDINEVIILKDIGRKIVDKCFGIPLLARVIGGLLRFQKTGEEWRHAVDGISKLFETESEYPDCSIPILELSYNHLPSQLKVCFAYCSLFPRGYEFDKEELVHLWMAAGILQHSTAQSMEQVGDECFNGLLKRSFFMPVDNSRFKMHHLMHDLAESGSRGVCCRLESNTMTESGVSERTCHLSLLRRQHYTPEELSVILQSNWLRTFYLINSPSDHGSCQLSAEALKAIFASLKRLRVLSLPHFQSELPASIGKLKYLRYLDVSHSALKRLPESLCTLYHLQTLILTNCSSLLMLPQDIVNLISLRKLCIKGAGLTQMPKEMSRLTSLQSLSNFIVGHGGSSIKELGALRDLHGSLSVSMLQNLSSASDASAANLNAMRYLDELELEWSCDNEDSATDQEDVLENLKPSGELKKLSIQFYGGEAFPNWLGDSSMLKITSLHLGDCRNCLSLPPLGQLSSLEHLIVEKFSRIKTIGHEFFGVGLSGCKPFQSLKTLKFVKMPEWEEWMLPEAEGEEFPYLEEFYVISCPMLKGDLPKSLSTLKKLEIPNCDNLMALLPQTSESCILKLGNCSKVRKFRKKLESDGEVASHELSSSITQISGNELQVEWSGNNQNPAKQTEVQEDLEPSGKLETPSIESYGGKEFLKWLEIYSLSKITFLCVSDNNSCSSLPPLGQLPFLEHLIIQRIGGVRSIGPEFYRLGLSFRKPFQSLKTLKFEAMSEWERWTPLEVEGEEFPCLQEFYMINCPKLEGDLPKCLPSLIKLEISECQQLAALLPWTSEHCVLKLENYDKVQNRSDDNRTVAPQLSPSIDQGDNRTEPSSREDGNQQFSSSSDLNVSSIGIAQSIEPPADLHSLRIERYASTMLPQEILERSSLQHLYLIDCIPLKIFHLSPSLKTLYIHNCKSLEFPQKPTKVMNQDADLEDLCLGSSCDSLKIFPLNYFPKLKSLSLWDCRNLEYLSIEKELQNELTSLDALEIKDCPNLRSFLEEEFQAPNLTSLVFFNCGSLKSLQCIQIFKTLQSLYINKCPALESFPMEGLPSGLIILCISFCDKITPQKGWKLDQLHSLSHFEIEGGCQNLESFPEEGLLPTNLISLRISGLLNLTSLDREGLQKLTCLQTLEINSCNKLDSLPEQRLPSSLSSLSITDCSLLNPKLQNKKGKEWFKIAHIPSIQLDEVSD